MPDCPLSATRHCTMHLASTCLLLSDIPSKTSISEASHQSTTLQTWSGTDSPAALENWPPCRRKPSGMQAAIARAQVNTLQTILGKSQCSDHGHLLDWVHFAESEKDWNQLQNDFMSQTQKRHARLGTGVPGPAVCSEWMETARLASF